MTSAAPKKEADKERSQVRPHVFFSIESDGATNNIDLFLSNGKYSAETFRSPRQGLERAVVRMLI